MRIFTLFLFLTILSSCAPLRVVRVLPEREADVVRYNYGAAIQESQAGTATAAISYYDATSDFLVFNVEITNQGKAAFHFDPAAILLHAGPVVVEAIDPELYLLDMDLTTVRQQRNARTWGWIGAGALVAGTIAIAAEGDSESFDNDNVVAAAAVEAVAEAAWLVAYTNDVRRERAYLAPEDLPTPTNRAFWLDYALRITTIAPGETAVGKLVFPRQDHANGLTINVPMPEGEVSFGFIQRVMRP